MSDIDFEEQLELERLEQEKKEKVSSKTRGTQKVDPDGTVYEWDAEKKAWFPKIDTDFIAKYQMNYGSTEQNTEGGTSSEQAFYENYYQAQMTHEHLLNKKKMEAAADETHAETVQKLETLENRMQEQPSEEYQEDSKEEMEKYTEEQKKQYNEYWSYYYSTDYHDYYADCMAQYDSVGDGKQEADSKATGGDTKDGKKGKKRKPQREQREEGWFNVSEEHNTNVYVSGLPLDITEDEFKELMNKYGLIMNDPRTRKPKLKLYMDENGQPKGDGRCCFIKKESVDLVLNLLDGYDLRGHKVKVERAQFNMKGDYDPTKKKKKLSNREKNKLKEKQAKLFDWRPDKPRGARARNEKVVVLKNVFDPKRFEEDPLQINVTRDAIKVECTKYGEVKKVLVYDCHQDGIVTVHFAEAEEADMCIEYMNQRYLGTRRLLAATWDGSTKYDVVETEAQRDERLKKWANFLESEEKTSNKSDTTQPTTAKPDATQASDTGEGDDTKQPTTATPGALQASVTGEGDDTKQPTTATPGASQASVTGEGDDTDSAKSADKSKDSEQCMDTKETEQSVDETSVDKPENPVDAT